MKWRFSKTIKTKLIAMMLFFSSIMFFASPAYASEAIDTDVGITFKQTEDSKPVPQDNTPAADKEKPVVKRASLPNTGETVKQLSILVGGMILIIISFVIILDRQVRMNSDNNL